MDKTPLILTGPPGCGKSYWIQKDAEQVKKVTGALYTVTMIAKRCSSKILPFSKL